MRILHLLNHADEAGNGIVNVAVDLACLQARSGHKVLVCSSGGAFVTLLQSYGVDHVQVEFRRTPTAIFRDIRALFRLIKSFKPDVVHAHMMTGTVLAKALKTRLPFPLVTHVHNEFQRTSILMGLGNRVIAVSQAVAKAMIKRGVPAKKLRVVPNSTIGSPRHPPLESYRPAPLEHPAIVTVAGMYQRKGILELLEAFEGLARGFPAAHLYLVGSGKDRQLFEERAERSPFRNRIHFEGFQKEPQPYFLAADIFVLASHREPFGLVLSEAREAGCAIVASNVDGIPEALANGKAGVLVPPHDAKALQKALTDLLSDPALLSHWRSNARRDAQAFTLRDVVREVDRIYQELLLPSTSPQKLPL